MAMREILYRGKRKDNGEWTYGNAVDIHDISGGVCIVNDIKWIMEQFIDCIYTSKVIPETVGEFTGLTDKNGVKIFEGDIISHEFFEGACAVVYNSETAGFELMNVQVYPGNRHPIIPGSRKYMTVIGNIFDNPEMMAYNPKAVRARADDKEES